MENNQVHLVYVFSRLISNKGSFAEAQLKTEKDKTTLHFFVIINVVKVVISKVNMHVALKP